LCYSYSVFMKIVLIDKEEGLKVGGIKIFNKRLYKYLSDKKHQVTILRFSNKSSKDKYLYHIPYYYAEPRSYIFIPSEKTLDILKKYLRKLKPDIVYIAIGISPLDFFIPAACHELNIPIAGVWHGDYNDSTSSFQMLVKSVFLAYVPFCQQLDLLHIFSQKLANFYIRRGINKDRITILPNGIDTDFYKPGYSYFGQKTKIGTGVLFLGRLTYVKNPEILIKSFLDINPPDHTKLVLVGHGEQEETLKEDYKDKRVIFTGLISDEAKKLDIIRACKVFVLPSKYEGMSLSLLEAMSCGLACIVSDAGANSELIKNAGILITEARLKQELPISLRLLLEYPEFASILGKKAREKVLKEYSQEMIFEKLCLVLEKTVSHYKRYGPPKVKPVEIDQFLKRKLTVLFRKLKRLGTTLTELS